MNRRAAILEGAYAAGRLHETLGWRHEIEKTGGNVDVFRAILGQHAVLMFRPLDGLLGFCIKAEELPGVVVSTQRSLRVQRFTGAHELGHVVLGHTQSLDGPEIIGRSDALLDEKEIAADSFASAFLIPKWLLQIHASRQSFDRDDMTNPQKVYQLALRVGASYAATCVALERHKIITAAQRQKLLLVERRTIKQELLQDVVPKNYYPDVWLLTERDEGARIEGSPEDIFIVCLKEQGGAGYVWNFEELEKAGFVVLRDERSISSEDSSVGGSSIRGVVAQQTTATSGRLQLEQKRPWQPQGDSIAALHLPYDLNGKEVGMPRALRKQLLAA